MFRFMISGALIALMVATSFVPAMAGEADVPRASFKKFATTWVADLERQAEAKRSGNTRFVAYDPSGVEISLQPTGNAAAPYVGTLTYTQDVFQCKSARQANCEKVESSPVTEIFPYQGGAWRY